LLAHFQKDAASDNKASAFQAYLEEKRTSDLPNYIKLTDTLSELYQDGSVAIESLAGLTELYPVPFADTAEVSIRGLGPFERMRRAYETSIKRFSDGLGGLKSEPPALNHNLISSAFLVRFGRVGVLLGGDVETEGWKEILNHRTFHDVDTLILKVSHHGS